MQHIEEKHFHTIRNLAFSKKFMEDQGDSILYPI